MTNKTREQAIERLATQFKIARQEGALTRWVDGIGDAESAIGELESLGMVWLDPNQDGAKERMKREIFKRAVVKWGVDAQVCLLLEEMSELQKELLKLKRDDYRYSAESIQPLIEETADVELMIDQIKYMFEFTAHDAREGKLQRLIQLLGDEIKIRNIRGKL